MFKPMYPMFNRKFNNSKVHSESECAVCYATHDQEIHDATLRIHQWLRGQVTHNFEDGAFFPQE